MSDKLTDRRTDRQINFTTVILSYYLINWDTVPQSFSCNSESSRESLAPVPVSGLRHISPLREWKHSGVKVSGEEYEWQSGLCSLQWAGQDQHIGTQHWVNMVMWNNTVAWHTARVPTPNYTSTSDSAIKKKWTYEYIHTYLKITTTQDIAVYMNVYYDILL